MSTRAAIYARISQEDTAVPKVEIQERNAVAVAEEEGASEVVPRVWTTGGVERSETAYVDNGIPATARSITEGTRHKRPAFDQLLTDAEAGRFDMIVATSGDRLARNYPDGIALVAACVAGGVIIVTEDEGRVDPRTPGGEERAMSLFVGGRKEIRARTAKQRRRYDRETEIGMPLWGRRTFGFAARMDENERGKVTRRWVLHEPTEADAIRWAVDYLLNTAEASIYGVAREFTRRGLKPVSAGFRSKRGQEVPWGNASIRELLTNPRLAAIVVRDGVVQEGVQAAWEPIISKELHAAIVAKLRDPNRRTSPGPKRTSLGSGIVRCGCGSPMRSMTANGKPGLRCEAKVSGGTSDPSASHQAIQSELADPLIAREVARAFLFGPSDLLGEDRVDVGPLEVELGKLQSERERLMRWVADDIVTEAEAVPQLRKLRLRQTELSEQIEAAYAASATSAMTARAARGVLHGPRVSFGNAHAALVTLEGRFKAMPLGDRRELVRRLLDVQVMPGRGAGRVKITHKVVTSLNDEYRDEETSA